MSTRFFIVLSYLHDRYLITTRHMTSRLFICSYDNPALFLSLLFSVTDTLAVPVLLLLCKGIGHS